MLVWGLSFKANTDDIRESRAIIVIELLLSEGAKVRVYDPEGMENLKIKFGDRVTYCQGMYDCIPGADALVVSNDWNEFRSPDWARIRSTMKDAVVFDGKNLYSTLKIDDVIIYGVGS